MSHAPDPGDDTRRRATSIAPEAKPERGPAQEKLAIFVGDWRGKGFGGAGSEMTTVETYDWIDGKFFLETRFDQAVGAARHVGVGLIGHDAQAGTYRLRMADNLGYARDYVVRDEGGAVWRFLGDRERATLTFKGDRMNVRWEHRPDGRDWAPLCEFDAVNRRAGTAH
jgi:hypothetical protein